MPTHADYCPIAVGVEVLGDRWTPLIIRELMVGSTGFNEIHRGLPRMSRSLLAQRLRALERRGLVSRQVAHRGRPGSYRLTASGEALTPIVWAIGHWAAQWQFGDPAPGDRDARTLLWRLHQLAVPSRLPEGRTVVHMRLTGRGGAEGWLDIDHGEVSVCTDDPGHDVDLAVEGDTGQVHRWVVGRITFRELATTGEVRAIGPTRLVRAFPTWFNTRTFAEDMRRSAQRVPA